MMHVSDIEEALAEKDARALEAAFRVLVDYPREEDIEGAESADTLTELLVRVAAALNSDTWAMAPDLARSILDRTDDVHALAAASYAEGAAIVVQHLECWKRLFGLTFAATEVPIDGV